MDEFENVTERLDEIKEDLKIHRESLAPIHEKINNILGVLEFQERRNTEITDFIKDILKNQSDILRRIEACEKSISHNHKMIEAVEQKLEKYSDLLVNVVKKHL